MSSGFSSIAGQLPGALAQGMQGEIKGEQMLADREQKRLQRELLNQFNQAKLDLERSHLKQQKDLAEERRKFEEQQAKIKALHSERSSIKERLAKDPRGLQRQKQLDPDLIRLYKINQELGIDEPLPFNAQYRAAGTRTRQEPQPDLVQKEFVPDPQAPGMTDFGIPDLFGPRGATVTRNIPQAPREITEQVPERIMGVGEIPMTEEERQKLESLKAQEDQRRAAANYNKEKALDLLLSRDDRFKERRAKVGYWKAKAEWERRHPGFVERQTRVAEQMVGIRRYGEETERMGVLDRRPLIAAQIKKMQDDVAQEREKWTDLEKNNWDAAMDTLFKMQGKGMGRQDFAADPAARERARKYLVSFIEKKGGDTSIFETQLADIERTSAGGEDVGQMMNELQQGGVDPATGGFQLPTGELMDPTTARGTAFQSGLSAGENLRRGIFGAFTGSSNTGATPKPAPARAAPAPAKQTAASGAAPTFSASVERVQGLTAAEYAEAYKNAPSDAIRRQMVKARQSGIQSGKTRKGRK